MGKSSIQIAKEICAKLLSDFDELWLIGHKGDHHNNLVDLKVLKDKKIKLAHVHSKLGVHAEYILAPPSGSSTNVTAAHTLLNAEIEKHFQRALKEDKKVCILAPFSHKEIDRLVSKYGNKNNFRITAPTNNCEDFFTIGNKIKFSEVLDKQICIPETSPSVPVKNAVIPWIILTLSDNKYFQLQQKLTKNSMQGIFLQVDVSASGDGTRLVQSQADLDAIFHDKVWNSLIVTGHVKASCQVLNAYSANGSACIVPIDANDCIVLVDPLSRKSTGLEELRGKAHSGVGNDWTRSWPIEIQRQYIAVTSYIGKLLYQQYGYTGIFGPDFIVESNNNIQTLRLTEINPRWQGTTPFQTLNAINADRVPLELIHYIIKLDSNGVFKNELIALIGNPDLFNKKSAASTGCFYIKIGNPLETKEIKKDLNGFHLYDGKRIVESSTNENLLEVYKDNNNSPISKAYFREKAKSPDTLLLNIKSPHKGEIVGGGGLTPIGYIVGMSSSPVFSEDLEGVSNFGSELYRYVVKQLFKK